MQNDVYARRERRISSWRGSGSGALKASVVSWAVVACAGPEPILKSTTHLQLHGKIRRAQGQPLCGLKAERSGLTHGTNRSGNVGAGATLEAHWRGGGGGASAGLVGGPPELLSGAAAGCGRHSIRPAGGNLQATSALGRVCRVR